VVISGQPHPIFPPLKTTSPKKGTIKVGLKELELMYRITKKGIVKRELSKGT
jgi:hypothetical protein